MVYTRFNTLTDDELLRRAYNETSEYELAELAVELALRLEAHIRSEHANAVDKQQAHLFTEVEGRGADA